MRLAGFPLGRIVATPGALEAFEQAGDSPGPFLKRHVTGDWGELDAEDRQENEESIVHGFRLLSAYSLSNGTKLWIITEADRSVATLLFAIGILMALEQARSATKIRYLEEELR